MHASLCTSILSSIGSPTLLPSCCQGRLSGLLGPLLTFLWVHLECLGSRVSCVGWCLWSSIQIQSCIYSFLYWLPNRDFSWWLICHPVFYFPRGQRMNNVFFSYWGTIWVASPNGINWIRWCWSVISFDRLNAALWIGLRVCRWCHWRNCQDMMRRQVFAGR